MNGALAVVGTDTDVGKTVVTAALVLALRRAGVEATPYKPVGAGGVTVAGRLVSADAVWWRRVLGLEAAAAALNPLCLKAPLAPAVAGRLEGRPVRRAKLDRDWRAFRRRHRAVLLESVGGALVPLGPGLLFADWLATLRIPAVVVGRAGLGTINHAALTVEALRARRITVRAVILNGARGHLAERTNPAEIAALTGVPVAAVLPWRPGVRRSASALAALARRLPASRAARWLGTA